MYKSHTYLATDASSGGAGQNRNMYCGYRVEVSAYGAMQLQPDASAPAQDRPAAQR